MPMVAEGTAYENFFNEFLSVGTQGIASLQLWGIKKY